MYRNLKLLFCKTNPKPSIFSMPRFWVSRPCLSRDSEVADLANNCVGFGPELNRVCGHRRSARSHPRRGGCRSAPRSAPKGSCRGRAGAPRRLGSAGLKVILQNEPNFNARTMARTRATAQKTRRATVPRAKATGFYSISSAWSRPRVVAAVLSRRQHDNRRNDGRRFGEMRMLPRPVDELGDAVGLIVVPSARKYDELVQKSASQSACSGK